MGTNAYFHVIYRIIGTPSAEKWPENVSLEKNVFLDWPRVCLRSLIPSLDVTGSDLLSVSIAKK